MYLPFDEWRLLVGYYYMIGEVGRPQSYHEGALGDLYKFRWSLKVGEYGDPSASTSNTTGKSFGKFLVRLKRAVAANRHLMKRGLIEVQRHPSETHVVNV